jgi:hypothetical protein
VEEIVEGMEVGRRVDSSEAALSRDSDGAGAREFASPDEML